MRPTVLQPYYACARAIITPAPLTPSSSSPTSQQNQTPNNRRQSETLNAAGLRHRSALPAPGCSTVEQRNGYGIATSDRPQSLGTSRQPCSILVPALRDNSRRFPRQHQTPDLIGSSRIILPALTRTLLPAVPTHPQPQTVTDLITRQQYSLVHQPTPQWTAATAS